MGLQTSGAISLNDVAGVFGGSTPHSLSEYYGAATGVPTSGPISLSDFYGKSNNPDPPVWVSDTITGYFAFSKTYTIYLDANSDSNVTYSLVSNPSIWSVSVATETSGDRRAIVTFLQYGEGMFTVTLRATDEENQSTDASFIFFFGRRAYWTTPFILSGTSYVLFLGSFPTNTYVYINLPQQHMSLSQHDQVSFQPRGIGGLSLDQFGVLSGVTSSIAVSGWGFSSPLVTSRFDSGTGNYYVVDANGSYGVFIQWNTY